MNKITYGPLVTVKGKKGYRYDFNIYVTLGKDQYRFFCSYLDNKAVDRVNVNFYILSYLRKTKKPTCKSFRYNNGSMLFIMTTDDSNFPNLKIPEELKTP